MTPNFVPFAAMTDADQREHLRRVHGTGPLFLEDCRLWHWLDERDGFAMFDEATPHTHDKPAPRTEENR